MQRLRATLALLALGLAACSSSAPAPHAATPPAVAVVTLADVGLERDSLDRTADPCTDFYQFACGGWLARTEIPADKSRWGRFAEIAARNEDVLHAILDEARALDGKGDPILVKLGDFYNACMDERAIEQTGLRGIQPLLDLAGKVADRASLTTAMIGLHRHAVLAAFGTYTDADRADSTVNALYVDSTGLGLPDREYYLHDDFKAVRDAYRGHLIRGFGLLGQTSARATVSADDVIVIETALAKLTKTAVERRDDAAMYHPTTLAELRALAPGFDWPAYLDAIGSPGLASVVLTSPEYIAGLDELMRTATPAQWSAYLTARVVAETAVALPRQFDNEAFALTRVLSGVTQQRDRWRRCVDATAAAMPEYLGNRSSRGCSRATRRRARSSWSARSPMRWRRTSPGSTG